MKKTLLFILLLFTGWSVLATPRWRYYWLEGTAGLGTALSMTDIGKMKFGLAPAAGFRYKFHPEISAKLQVAALFLNGTDAGTDQDARGYAYNAWILEPVFQLEYIVYRSEKDIPGYNVRGLDMDMRKTEVYTYLGIGATYTHPTPSAGFVTDYQDDYDHWGRSIPLGAGIRYNFNYHWSLNAELGYHFSNTDYLEGLRSGNRNDRFFLGLVQVCYRFGTRKSSSLNMKSI